MTELIWPNNYNIVDIFLLIGNYIIVENCINKLNQKNILVLVSISIRNNNHD